jgi:putative membrane protein
LNALGQGDDQAAIDYYVNQKLNPIAPHITGIGATDLQTELDEQFTNALASVSLGIFDNLNSYLGSADGSTKDMSDTATDGLFAYGARVASEVESAAADMDEAGRTVSELGDIASMLAGIAQSSADALATHNEVGANTNEVLAEAYAALQSQQSAIDSSGTVLADALRQIAADYRNLETYLTSDLKDSANTGNATAKSLDDTARALKIKHQQ